MYSVKIEYRNSVSFVTFDIFFYAYFPAAIIIMPRNINVVLITNMVR